jgi:hypothetical protein
VDVKLPGRIPLRGEEPVPDVFASSNGSGQSRVAEDVPLRILSDQFQERFPVALLERALVGPMES